MNQGDSYRTILRSSSITAMASALNILSAIVRLKVTAVVLGPSGVGLIGLYQNLMQTASTLSALGFDTVGTRQIAAASASGDMSKLAVVRRALLWGMLGLALLGSALFWLSSGWIATNLLGNPELSGDVAWLSIGIALMVASASQGATLAGLRRIGDLACVQAAAGILSAVFGILAIWLWGFDGLLSMVLIAPLLTFFISSCLVARLAKSTGPPARIRELAPQWHMMVSLGGAIMFGGLVTAAGQLAVRTLVERELGTDALGQFQAAWVFGMTYLAFVLSAMGTDYYPRLTGAIGDTKAACRLVNEQTEVALLLCTPVLLAVLGLAPQIVGLLYSSEFGPAAEILRWQLLGDILKLMSWPLGFLLLASGAGRTFIVTESVATGVFVLVTAAGLPLFGIKSTGIAYLALYAIYLPLVWWVGYSRFGFAWTPIVRWLGMAAISAALVIIAAARTSEVGGQVAGSVLAALFALLAIIRLLQMTASDGRPVLLARTRDRFTRWLRART